MKRIKVKYTPKDHSNRMRDREKILLKTKLNRPPVAHSLIERHRLFERLDQGISRPLTLVVASAGFGKTTLVSAWLEWKANKQGDTPLDMPVAWLSLDDNDSELDVFIRYFVAALQTIFPNSGEQALQLLQARQTPPPGLLYTTLSNEIEKLPHDFILVLDDYHTLQGLEVHNLLKEWSRHWPQKLHLVLISRLNPPIPLAVLRARGQVGEIRTNDLRFTPAEMTAYLNQAQFFQLSPSTLELLDERIEGWIAGLQLAALSLRSAESQEAALAGLSVEDSNIASYLMSEVLNHQYPVIHRFLLITSILDRFCTSLCEAVVGEIDSAWNARACLDWIERSELFIIPLDNRREWYRYHHLFQDLLRQRLAMQMSSNQVAELHRLASIWFEEHGLVEEALHHALTAGNMELAARQMTAGLCDVTNQEDRPTLERWLRLLPEDAVQQHPGLLMAKVWALEFSWRLDLQAQALLQVEALLATPEGVALGSDDLLALRGQTLAIKAQQACLSNRNTDAIHYARQALQLLPPKWEFVRGGAMLYLGMALQANGQAAEAEKLLFEEFEAQSDKTGVYALNMLRVLCFIYLNTGQLQRCEQTARLLLAGSTTRKNAILKNWSEWFLGLVHYQRNDLEQAAGYYSQIVENPYTAQVTTVRDAYAALALIYAIQGEPEMAWQTFDSISRYDLQLRGIEDERTRALRARLMLTQGDLEGAGRWADGYSGPPPDVILLWLAEPQTMRVRALLSRGKPEDLQQARQLLDALEEITDRTHNTRFKIQVMAFRAVMLDAEGITSQAEFTLLQALELARPGGFIRVFVDLGQPMRSILLRLAGQDQRTGAIQRILAAFPGPENAISNNAHQATPAHLPLNGNRSLADPLTPRELEVLALLRGPLSIKEIALKLHISYATAKRHTINIYGKLGVNQRWHAAARAEELNIL